MSEKKLHGNSKFDKSYCELVHKLCLLGAGNKEIADILGISVKTLIDWKNNNEELCKAIEEGREIADAEVSNSLYHRAKGYSRKEEKIFQYQGQIVKAEVVKHIEPDVTAAQVWLRNRRRNVKDGSQSWEDSTKHTFEIEDALSDEAIQKRIDELMEKRQLGKGSFGNKK